MYKVREGKDSDRDSAIRLMWKAFDVATDLEKVQKEDWAQGWHRPEKRDWSYVAVDGDEVIANISFFDHSDNIIRGNPISFSAVWGVATKPEYRRSGLIRAIFKECFPRMREEGLYLSVLDPFSRSFYEKFGYALAEDRYRHTIPSQEFRLVDSNPKVMNRELENPDDFEKVLQIQRSMARFGSRAFHTQRTLSKYIKENHFHLLERDRTPMGAVKFNFKGMKLESEYRLNLEVFLCAFTSWEIFPSIMRLIAQYATNVKNVFWYGCDPQVPVRQYVKDYWKVTSERYGSMMMRVVDFPKYCQQIAVNETVAHSVIVKIKDEYCPWNDNTYRLSPEDGRLDVEETSEIPNITLDALQVSKVVSGLTPATLLRGLGEIDCSNETAERLDAIWPADIFITYQRF